MKNNFLKTLMIFFLFPFSIYAETIKLVEVDLSSNPRTLEDPALIKIANELMDSGIYWEDEGYEYKKTDEAYSLEIKKLFKHPQSGELVKVQVHGVAHSGGFGWHSGYKEGTSYCTISILKIEGVWSSKDGDADCETELDS